MISRHRNNSPIARRSAAARVAGRAVRAVRCAASPLVVVASALLIATGCVATRPQRPVLREEPFVTRASDERAGDTARTVAYQPDGAQAGQSPQEAYLRPEADPDDYDSEHARLAEEAAPAGPPIVIEVSEAENAEFRAYQAERERQRAEAETARYGRVLTDAERDEVREHGRILAPEERIELKRLALERQARRDEQNLRERALALEKERMERETALEQERLAIERERLEQLEDRPYYYYGPGVPVAPRPRPHRRPGSGGGAEIRFGGRGGGVSVEVGDTVGAGTRRPGFSQPQRWPAVPHVGGADDHRKPHGGDAHPGDESTPSAPMGGEHP